MPDYLSSKQAISKIKDELKGLPIDAKEAAVCEHALTRDESAALIKWATAVISPAGNDPELDEEDPDLVAVDYRYQSFDGDKAISDHPDRDYYKLRENDNGDLVFDRFEIKNGKAVEYHYEPSSEFSISESSASESENRLEDVIDFCRPLHYSEDGSYSYSSSDSEYSYSYSSSHSSSGSKTSSEYESYSRSGSGMGEDDDDDISLDERSGRSMRAHASSGSSSVSSLSHSPASTVATGSLGLFRDGTESEEKLDSPRGAQRPPLERRERVRQGLFGGGGGAAAAQREPKINDIDYTLFDPQRNPKEWGQAAGPNQIDLAKACAAIIHHLDNAERVGWNKELVDKHRDLVVLAIRNQGKKQRKASDRDAERTYFVSKVKDYLDKYSPRQAAMLDTMFSSMKKGAVDWKEVTAQKDQAKAVLHKASVYAKK